MTSESIRDDIRNLSFDELSSYIESIGDKSFRARQIYEWLYKKNVVDFSDMRNLSGQLRDQLSKDFNLTSMNVTKREVSSDGTTKYLFDLKDHEKIETVIIPTQTRTTACVSTQAGCKFGCRFCASGVGGWNRNLSCAEVIGQIQHVKAEALQLERPLSHIVFMGIGEPMSTVKYNRLSHI